ncbi:MAG: hypothetical protein E7609_04355 [Ruminococcaceae bacterium]|nr:hypothetical protein [Oscillospiraceae bacterium]
MAYIIIISLSALLITLGCFLFEGIYTLAAFLLLLLTTLFEVATVIAIDGVFAFLIRRLPQKWFAPMRRIFAVGEREARLYRRLGLQKWKRFVPELGCFTGFHKDRLRDSKSSAYLGRFLLESNYGVAGHIAGAVGGFLLLLLPKRGIGVFVALVNLVLNLMPTAVLRANTPALRRLYERSLAREAREHQ